MLSAAVTLGIGLRATPFDYPFPAPAQAVGFVESHLGPHDALLVDTPWYSFAAESSFTPVVLAQPTLYPGFVVGFKDPRIHTVGVFPNVTSEQIGKDVEGAKKVLVYDPERSILYTEMDAQETVDRSLTTLGFKLTTFPFQDAKVEVWEHPGTAPPGAAPRPSVGAAASGPPLVKVAINPKYGAILVNAQGDTLYVLANHDKPVLCDVKACEQTAWDPLLLPLNRHVPTAGPFVRSLGLAGRHVPYVITWSNILLFTFAGDKAPGETNGFGIADFGGTWQVVHPATGLAG